MLIAPLPSPLRAWLAFPFLRNLWARGRVVGGGVSAAPYFALHDLVETGAVFRGDPRRGLML